MIGLPPGVTTTLAGTVGRAARAVEVVGDGLSQIGLAGGGAVVGPAVADGADAGLADVAGGVEIGFADLEVDDVAALRFQRAGADEDFERGFGAEPLHAGREFHGTTFCLSSTNVSRARIADDDRRGHNGAPIGCATAVALTATPFDGRC